MNRLVVVGNGHVCIREKTLELKFLDDINNHDIVWSPSLEETDYILYITCAGVGDTIIKCLREIKCIIKYKQKEQKLIIVGCLTNLEGLLDDLNGREDIKIITSFDWNLEVSNYILNQNKRINNQIILENRTKNYFDNDIAIHFFMEKGCINNCSFCKKNYTDIPVQSLPYDIAMNYLKEKIKNGTRIINLGGENLTLYGLDLYGKQMLHKFVKELSEEPSLISITLNEITAANMYPELLEEMVSNPKVKNISMQLESASDRLLSLMNRNYNMEVFDDIVSKLKEKNKTIWTLLMSGFPTETYDDINMTINYMKSRKIVLGGICEYVDFKYIPSSNLEQLSKREKREHTMYLKRALVENNYEIFKSNMSELTNPILVGNIDGYHVFVDDTREVGISKNKKYDEVMAGSIIYDKPKRLVRKSKFGGEMTYIY